MAIKSQFDARLLNKDKREFVFQIGKQKLLARKFG